MAETPTIKWEGASGALYTYWIYPLGIALNAKAGNYAFAKETKPGYFVPLYFGETGDLATRFDSHHKIDCAKQNGATHVHAHLNEGGDDQRRNEESDLVKKWSPVCNG
jgi:hypothetical protein